MGPEKVWVLKNFGSRKYFAPKKLLVLKSFGLKNSGHRKFGPWKNLGPVKIRVPKTCGSWKNLGPKRFLVPKNYWFQKIIKLGLVGRIGMGRQGSRHLLDTFQRHYKNIPDTFQTPSRHLKRQLLDNLKTPQLFCYPLQIIHL